MSYNHWCKLLIATFVFITVGACGGDPGKGVDIENSVVNGVNFVGVTVSDMQRTADFYKGSVNLESVATGSISNNQALGKLAGRADLDVSTQLMKSANAQLLFMQFANQSDAAKQSPRIEVYGPGIAHVCYQVNEETGAYHHALDAGATHIGEREMIQLNPRNPVKYAYSRDLDETIFEVEHVDVKQLDLPEPPKNDYRIRHVSLATPDINRAIKFYSVLLDQKKPRRIGRFISISGDKLDQVSGLPESKIKMAFFQVRNVELEIIQYVSHPSEDLKTPRPVDALGYNMIVLDVKNMDEARNKFIEAGGEIVSDVEPMLGGDVLFGRDPDGNLIGLQVSASDSVVSSKNFSDNGI